MLRPKTHLTAKCQAEQVLGWVGRARAYNRGGLDGIKKECGLTYLSGTRSDPIHETLSQSIISSSIYNEDIQIILATNSEIKIKVC